MEDQELLDVNNNNEEEKQGLLTEDFGQMKDDEESTNKEEENSISRSGLFRSGHFPEVNPENLPPILESIPEVSPVKTASKRRSGLTPMAAKYPPLKRTRRMGVNAGAHEQIIRLNSTVDIVTGERDFWREKCRKLQIERETAIRERDEMADELTKARKIIKASRKQQQKK